MVYNNVTELIGKTPVVKLDFFCEKVSAKGIIYGKFECFNPAGSIKDRVALNMILSAEKDGVLKKGSVIIEPTSGNTGIGLASIGARFGYKVILTMPDTMSKERISLLKAYGAEVVLTDGKKGMQGAVDMANSLKDKYENSFIPSQFENPENPNAHYKTTGPEIWEDLGGNFDIFISCIGTGGTISGTGRYLKEQNPHIKVIGVEPLGSPLLTKGVSGPHLIQGIGANFVPDTLDREVIDEIVTVSDNDAYLYSKTLAATEGVLTGISSGAALAAAKSFLDRPENKGKRVVVILPDTGDRYLSNSLFD